MFLIAGLGNPGLRYFKTRHNIGFLVLDKLAEYFKIGPSETVSNELYISAGISSDDKQIVLMKPLTYMNLSGRAVKEFSDINEVSKENILIIYDDINLDFGTLRIRPSGSDGGQNGIKSVIYEFESEDIPRLRIGIKTAVEYEKVEDGSKSLADYVLDEFSGDEMKNLDIVLNAAKDAVLSFLQNGMQETMNSFNKKFLE